MKNAKVSTNLQNGSGKKTSKEDTESTIDFDKIKKSIETVDEDIPKKEPSKQRRRKKDFPIPIENLANILTELPDTVASRLLKSWIPFSKEEKLALKNAWMNYLEFALDLDKCTPLHVLIAGYIMVLLPRSIPIIHEVKGRVKHEK